MTPPETRSASLLLRLEGSGATTRIRTQELRSGELREFVSWEAFVAYAASLLGPPALK